MQGLVVNETGAARETRSPAMKDSTITFGYCQCGCGEKTNLARQNSTKKGWVKGSPLFFINGHSNRGPATPRKGSPIKEWFSDSLNREMSAEQGESLFSIPLTKGMKTIVDKQDYSELSQWNWQTFGRPEKSPYSARTVYVLNNKQRSGYKLITVFLHRQILRLPVGSELEGDHVNGDPLDNRRSNLRIVSHRENSMNQKRYRTNTSGCSGVTFHKRNGKWNSSITVNYKKLFLGAFQDFESAVMAREQAEDKYYGDYARKEIAT